EIAPADSAIQTSIENVQGLQIELTQQVNKLTDALEKIDGSHAVLSANIFKPELVNIWTPVPVTRPLKEILEFSAEKNILALKYYADNNEGAIIFCLLIIIVL